MLINTIRIASCIIILALANIILTSGRITTYYPSNKSSISERKVNGESGLPSFKPVNEAGEKASDIKMEKSHSKELTVEKAVRKGLIKEDPERKKIRENVEKEYRKVNKADLCDYEKTVDFQNAIIERIRLTLTIWGQEDRGIYTSEFLELENGDILDASSYFSKKYDKSDIAGNALSYHWVDPDNVKGSRRLKNSFKIDSKNSWYKECTIPDHIR